MSFASPRPSENRLLKGSNSYLKKRRLETVLLLYFILASVSESDNRIFFSFSKNGVFFVMGKSTFCRSVGRSVSQSVVSVAILVLTGVMAPLWLELMNLLSIYKLQLRFMMNHSAAREIYSYAVKCQSLS